MAENLIPILLLIALAFGAWQLHRLVLACRRANRVEWGLGWMNLLDGFNRLFCYRYHRLNLVRLRIPRSGPAILAANHVSGLDPMLLLASARRPIRFLIAREEYERFGLNWLFRAIKCIPVDRETRPELALRAAMRSLQQGHVVAIFPHGRIHTDVDGSCRIKPGALRLAQLTGADILPLRISGIRGAGHVVRGVVLRSRAQLEAFPRIVADGRELGDLLDELQQILDGRQ
ncbi:MAG: 1-acyl-sn-glycerol-3-phosphate acyltransferase [Gammaproteobacteria bacterium]|nr:1-acyl-sn-glycerol-3-phosphate acyltransferase [Gammaproteobacteria bacterium]